MPVRKLYDLVDKACGKGKPARIAVAAAQDPDVILALDRAARDGFVSPILIGDRKSIERIADNSGVDISAAAIVQESNTDKAGEIAVSMARHGEADVIMKGKIQSATLFKAILDKENGLEKKGILSHFALFESPYYHKLIGLTDAALNIAPNLEDKSAMIMNAIEICHALGIENPKIAVLAAIETVNPKIEATLDAAALKARYMKGDLQGCVLDGPLALDNAVSATAAGNKGIHSLVAGDADVLVTPDINSGNILYKSLNFLGGTTSAAIVTGASVPVVLTSRADLDTSKYFSIAFAVALS